jgi:Cu-Zn family superoxide dismutase
MKRRACADSAASDFSNTLIAERGMMGMRINIIQEDSMNMLRVTVLNLGFAALAATLPVLAHAGEASVDMHLASKEGEGDKIGRVIFTDNEGGVDVMVDLHGLTPGLHGFHVHENPDCSPTSKDGQVVPAGAAGGHFDPHKTGKHLGPGGGGHLGDLPALAVGDDGKVKTTLHLNGVKAEDFKNRSLMIHVGGDNYADQPAPLGGGGARFACGVFR